MYLSADYGSLYQIVSAILRHLLQILSELLESDLCNNTDLQLKFCGC